MKKYLFTSATKADYSLPSTLDITDNLLTITEAGRQETNQWHTFTLNKVPFNVTRKFLKSISSAVYTPNHTSINVLISFDGGVHWETYRPYGSSNPSPNYKNMVTAMTGNNTSRQIATASSVYSTSYYDAYRAFRGHNTDYYSWITANGVQNGYVQIEFEQPFQLSKFSITTRNYSENGTTAPKTWRLSGSNDGVDFTHIYDSIDERTWGANEERFYHPNVNLAEYRFYRLTVDENFGGPYLAVGALKLYSGRSPYWEVVDLDSIGVVGIPIQSLSQILEEHLIDKKGATNISLAIALNTEVDTAAPSLQSLTFQSVAYGETMSQKYTTLKRPVLVDKHIKLDSITPAYKHYGANLKGNYLQQTAWEGKSHDLLKKPNGLRSPFELFYYPSIYAESNFTGFVPTKKTHYGVKYGVGWVETPQFKPRISPSYYHPAIYNGQKENSQPLL